MKEKWLMNVPDEVKGCIIKSFLESNDIDCKIKYIGDDNNNEVAIGGFGAPVCIYVDENDHEVASKLVSEKEGR